MENGSTSLLTGIGLTRTAEWKMKGDYCFSRVTVRSGDWANRITISKLCGAGVVRDREYD